jgi:hypothetical protein
MTTRISGSTARAATRACAGRARPAARAILSALFLWGGTAPLQGQPVPACNMSCPPPQICNPFDEACKSYNADVVSCEQKQASCQAKYLAYDAYLQQMGAGVTLYALTGLYRDVLAAHYPGANLSEVRYGYSNRQPADNATADCDRIYFNGASYVDALRAGELKDVEHGLHGFGWILHELAHFEQCRQVGSRDAYAKMWWDHLSEAELSTMIENGSWKDVHDRMQMEQQADARRDETAWVLRRCCIHPTTRQLIRPLSVAPLVVSPGTPTEGQTVTFSASASNGAEPLTYRWRLRGPGASAPSVVIEGSGATAQHVPDAPGRWTVFLDVTQPSGSLRNDHSDERSFTVAELLPVVAALTVEPGSVTGGAGAQGSVQVTSLKPGASVEVQLAASQTSVQVPPAVTVTASGNGTGSATFPITTSLVPITRTVTLTAAAAGGTASAAMTVVGIALEPLRFNRTELEAGELLEVRLLLDRPPPVSITVVLESSDARALGVPGEVVFRAGEQQKTIAVRIARDLDRELAVTLRAHTLHDAQTRRDQVIQLRPPR